MVMVLPGCNPFGDLWTDKAGSDASLVEEGSNADGKGEDLRNSSLQGESLQGEPLVEFDGVVVATMDDLDENLALVMQANPALKDVLAYLPAEQQEQIMDQLVEAIAMEKLMRRWVDESGISRTAEYREMTRRAHEALDKDLASRAFETEIVKNIKISDEEARNFYAMNRTDPLFQRAPFTTQMGGIKAESIEADSPEQAKELVADAQTEAFAEVAERAGKEVKDYGLVGPMSFINEAIKTAIVKAGEGALPTTFDVDVNGTPFVIHVVSKQETEYAPFSQVKDAVIQVMTGKRATDMYIKKIEQLKNAYKMKVHKDSVKKRQREALEAPSKDKVAKPPAGTSV